jgi:hypothetical protein
LLVWQKTLMRAQSAYLSHTVSGVAVGNLSSATRGGALEDSYPTYSCDSLVMLQLALQRTRGR